MWLKVGLKAWLTYNLDEPITKKNPKKPKNKTQNKTNPQNTKTNQPKNPKPKPNQPTKTTTTTTKHDQLLREALCIWDYLKPLSFFWDVVL